MKANLQSIANAAANGLRKFKAVADAVAGSPVTHEMERLVPGLSRLVGDVESVARIAGVLGSAMPALPLVIGVIEGLHDLGARPMDASDADFLARARELGA
jgi:hypothetical protein